jgi:hypothetical protein
MVSSGNRNDRWAAVEKMVEMFNKNFGSRIFIHKDPKNKSRGKRKIDDVCDDLYMVADRVHGQISDHPGAVKAKLEQQLKKLENAKIQVDRQFGSLMSSALTARGNDNVAEKLKNITTMQNVVNNEITSQLSSARDNLGTILKEYKGQVDTSGNILPLESRDFLLDRNTMSKSIGNVLGDYNKIRFIDNRKAQEDRIKKLVEIAQLSAPAINECQRCINKFDNVIQQAELGTQGAVEKLSNKARSMLANTTDPYQRQQILNCYSQLINDTDSCAAGAKFAASVEDGGNSLMNQMFGNEGVFRDINSQLVKLGSMRRNKESWQRVVYGQVSDDKGKAPAEESKPEPEPEASSSSS